MVAENSFSFLFGTDREDNTMTTLKKTINAMGTEEATPAGE
jgi:hypothetical protein